MTGFFATFQNWLHRERARRDIARTRHFLAELPEDIRKDIGWLDDERLEFSKPSPGHARDTPSFWEGMTGVSEKGLRHG